MCIVLHLDICRVKEAFYVGPPAKDKLPKVFPTKILFYRLTQNLSSCHSISVSCPLCPGHCMIYTIYLQNSREGSVLFGPISYEGGKGLQKNPASYQISYIVPPIKVFPCILLSRFIFCNAQLNSYISEYFLFSLTRTKEKVRVTPSLSQKD